VAEIKDTGVGIPPAIVQQIFDPFFTTKEVGAGMGLGLAISQNLVTGLGGEIEVDSKPGQGTTFRVSIPAAATEPTTTRTSSPAPLATRRGKVLIIDDDLAVTTALQRMLKDLHDVTLTTSARDAFAAIASSKGFDVIFCDVMMPDISGIEVYESVRTANRDQARRIVFMTGGAFTPRTQKFLATTENTHIAKPFSTETVRSIARDYARQPPLF